jgi:acyl-CoA synthetase (AMP-forming)/AMP-acid ligase II
MTRAPDFPPYPPTSGELARAAAARHGDRDLAVLGDERLTYAEAEARSAALARGLLATGAGKGTRVGILAGNGPDWIVAWLGITRMGAVAVLLNTYSRPAQLGWTLRHSDAQSLLTVDAHLGQDVLDRLERAVPGLAGSDRDRILVPSQPYLRSVWAWGEGHRPWAAPLADLLAAGEAVDPDLLAACEAEVTPADPMLVVYSSGSTSDPKGAVHSHGAAVRHAHNLLPRRDLGAGDVLYSPMPLFWVGGFSFTLISAMHAGATVVFEERFDPPATLRLIERERVTHVLGWPHVAAAMVGDPTFPERDTSSVRYGLVPPPRPEANSLGMTETLGPHTYGMAGEALLPERQGSFGTPVAGVEHRVVDPVTLADEPPGVPGELWVRGYSLMLGLHKRERAETFTADGWYRTGDAGWFDEAGHLHFTGRMGDLIKTSGMNVIPRDVELALEALPEVEMAFVTGIDHAQRGQDVVAAVALRPGQALDGEEARVRVKEAIASYQVPRHVAVFADRTELPWLDSGKVDRRRLAALLDERFREG